MNVKKIHRNPTLTFYAADVTTSLELPLVGSTVSAGFPSPAEDHVETQIDLNKELIKNPYSTFFVRVSGNSMQDMRILDGDLLIVDKSLEPQNRKPAVCFVDGEFTVKAIRREQGKCWLMPANEAYEPILVSEENEFMIWGIVTHNICSF